MSGTFVITGTDTDIGKTVFAAALTAALGASYWKPVQAGLAAEPTARPSRRHGGIDPSPDIARALPAETPASPHFAAAQEGITIALE